MNANIDHDQAPGPIREKIKGMIRRRVTIVERAEEICSWVDAGQVRRAVQRVALFSAYPYGVWDEVQRFYEETPIEITVVVEPAKVTVEDIRQKLVRLVAYHRGLSTNMNQKKMFRDQDAAVATAYQVLLHAITDNDLSIMRES